MSEWIESGEDGIIVRAKLNSLHDIVYEISGATLGSTSGISGSSGRSGTSGKSGSSGTSGRSGSSGISGTNGTSGTSGTTGTSGTSGVSGDHNLLSSLQGGSSGGYYHLTVYNHEILRPNGFYEINENRVTTISYSGLTVTITADSPPFVIWAENEYEKDTESITISSESGLHFIYYSFGEFGPLVESMVPWSINRDCPITIAYVQNGEIIMLGDERHGAIMDADTHKYLHNSRGTQYVSGLDIFTLPMTSGSPSTDGTNTHVVLNGGTLYDEDLIHVITNGTGGGLMVQDLGDPLNIGTSPAKLPVWYRLGTGTTNWYKLQATSFPFTFNSLNNRPQYSYDNSGYYELVDVPDGYFYIVWIFGTNDIETPVSSFIDGIFSTLERAQSYSNLNYILSNLPSAEYKILYRLIYHYSSSYSQNVKYSRLSDVLDYRKDSYNHNVLVNRDAINAHPASAIYLDNTKLHSGASAITSVQEVVEYMDYSLSKDGFMDYNQSSGFTQSYTAYTGTTFYFMKVLNDGLGIYTQKSFRPSGVTELWNTTTNQFNFSELNIGDEVMIRTDGEVTTTTQNQIFGTKITFDLTGYPYDLQLSASYFKTAGTYHINRIISFYIGNPGTRDNPAELLFYSDENATIKLNGYYISVRRRY